MPKYQLDFILSVRETSTELIRNSLIEFGEGLEISLPLQDGTVKTHNLKIHIFTEDPTVIFDTCAQFGRIGSVKVNEIK